MSWGLGSLKGKAVAEVDPPDVKSFKLEKGKCRLIGSVGPTQNDSTSFLLYTFNLSALILCETTMENRSIKIQGGVETGLVLSGKLVTGSPKGLDLIGTFLKK